MEHRLRLNDREVHDIIMALIHYRGCRSCRPSEELLDSIDNLIHRFQKVFEGTYGKRMVP